MPSSFATNYTFFVDEIQKKCNLPNTLIIKKSYLSLLKDSKDCENSFVNNLLRSCALLDCSKLQTEFYVSQRDKMGNIIGGSK